MTLRRRARATFVLDAQAYKTVYGPDQQRALAELVDVDPTVHSAESMAAAPQVLGQTEVILSGWGAPRVDETLLAAAPRLELICYAAGSVRGFVTDASWDRGVRVTHAATPNATAVAEYTLGAILLSLKHVWRLSAELSAIRQRPDLSAIPGNHARTVGIVSFGAIGRRVCELLGPLDHCVLVTDPWAGADDVAAFGAELVGMPELFARSDVVSLHTPLLAETIGMVDRHLLESMQPFATLINTARGALIAEPDLIEVFAARTDLTAVLDVTVDDPPAPTSRLYDLGNVVLTPHIAGSHGNERQRMASFVIKDLRRYLDGRPMLGEITRSSLARRA